MEEENKTKQNQKITKVSESQARTMRKKLNIDSEKILSDPRLDISCRGCTQNFCCVNQQHIQVFDLEFELLDYYITDEHKAKAKEQLLRTDGKMDCPFNNKEGQCDIYENRFHICSSHAVVSPIEHCNAAWYPGKGTMIIDKSDVLKLLPASSKAYMMSLLRDGNGQEHNRCIIQQFKRVYGEEDETPSS